MIKQHLEQIKQGEKNPVEFAEQVLQEAKEAQQHGYFTYLNQNLTKDIKKTQGELKGLIVSVKDAIWVKGMPSQAGSRILDNFIPFEDASLIKKLRQKGAVFLGKTSQDEFGYGSFGINTRKEWIAKNPKNYEKTCGGSSSGSAGYTAYTKYPHISIGESTGGSIACPSSFCGVVGLTPTYGAVSRYGVIDLANSLDKPGPIGKTIDDVFFIFDLIKGTDEKDSTSYYPSKPKQESKNELKFGFVSELFNPDVLSKEVYSEFKRALKKIESKFQVEEISLKENIEYGVSVYGILSMSETSTNLAKYSGLRYGKEMPPENKTYNKYFSEIRTKEFEEETKRRLLLGTFARMSGYRDAFYLRAARARTKLFKEYSKAFKSVDIILNPATPYTAPSFEEIKTMSPLKQYFADLCLVPANLAGLPHLSIPLPREEDKMPQGILLTAKHYSEQELYLAGKNIEGLL